MKLNNIRLGHATNSSSSHSILVLNHEYADIPTSDPAEDGEFGWQPFVLTDINDKRKYVYALLQSSVLSNQSDYIKQLVAKDIFGMDLPDNVSSYYVDHQSVPVFPKKYASEETIDWDFVNALKEALLKDNVVILGGNDNSEDEFYSYEPRHRLDQVWGYQNVVSRYDPKGYWTLFNRDSGTKIRLNFNTWDVQDNVKLTGPELIDLKITDYCPYDCPFCYQGSTAKGVHANLTDWDIYSLARTFNEMGVLEVAIGGGEPTFHPKFAEFLRTFNEHGINANFTTRSTHWMDNELVLKNTAKFAYSVEKVEQIEKILSELKKRNIHKDKLNIHIVMGTVTKEVFKDLLQYCFDNRVSVTLLGYKYVERGVDYTPINYDWWYEVLHTVYAGSYYREIAVDTVMIQQYKDLISRVASQKTYHLTEGSHSLYIDLVAKQIAPSSYSTHKIKYNKFNDIPGLFKNLPVE